MTGAAAFARAARAHREAVEAAAETLAALDPSVWGVAPRPGKWTPAEIAEHLIISYDPPLSELSGGPGFVPRLPWWQTRALRWTVLPRILRGGRFPRRAPAPREIRPTQGARDPADAVRRLRDAAARFEAALTTSRSRGRVRLSHAYFGRLSPVQILNLMAVHLRHHRAQFPNAPRREKP